jgi:hypothetical protein
MLLSTWHRTAARTGLSSRDHHPPRRPPLRVEQFEDRTLPSGSQLLAAAGSDSDPLRIDPVLLWNEVANIVHVIDHTPGNLPGSGLFVQGGPTRAARAYGMVQGAVFDAVNAIDRSYTPYLLTRTFGAFASKPAAVAAAAHDTLASLFPQQRAALDEALQRYLAAIPNGEAENEGVRAGRAAAVAMLAARRNDGADAPMSYTPGNLPGQHRVDPLNPNQGFLAPGWGDVVPFTLNAGGGTDAFQSPPPPALTSAAYATAFNEVKVVGAEDAEMADRDRNGRPDRTREQTVIGIYWGYDGSRGLGTPPRLYNQIARTLAVQERNSLVENARLFALVNLAMADVGIQCWDAKYDYDFWRPILGVREADPGTGPTGRGDGNPFTRGEADWRPLGAPNTNAPPGSINFTPPFPAYGSGHASFGAVLFKTLGRFYGRDDIRFTFVSDEFNGRNRDVSGAVRPRIPRTFSSFSQASEENGQSRIYLGIHWAFDKTGGIAAGNRIANFVFDNFLRPRRHDRGESKAVTQGTGDLTGDLTGFRQGLPAPQPIATGPIPPADTVDEAADPELAVPIDVTPTAPSEAPSGVMTTDGSDDPADDEELADAWPLFD